MKATIPLRIVPALAAPFGFMLASRVTGAALKTDGRIGSDFPPLYFPTDEAARHHVTTMNSRNNVRDYVLS